MNSTDQQSVHKSEKLLRKKLFVLYSYSILSSSIYIVRIFCLLHNKVALLTRCSERGIRNRHQRIFRKVLPNHTHIENIDQKINFYGYGETEVRLYRSFSKFWNVFVGLCTLVFKRRRKVIYSCLEIKKS